MQERLVSIAAVQPIQQVDWEIRLETIVRITADAVHIMQTSDVARKVQWHQYFCVAICGGIDSWMLYCKHGNHNRDFPSGAPLSIMARPSFSRADTVSDALVSLHFRSCISSFSDVYPLLCARSRAAFLSWFSSPGTDCTRLLSPILTKQKPLPRVFNLPMALLMSSSLTGSAAAPLRRYIQK